MTLFSCIWLEIKYHLLDWTWKVPSVCTNVKSVNQDISTRNSGYDIISLELSYNTILFIVSLKSHDHM